MSGPDNVQSPDVIVPRSNSAVRAIARVLFVSRWLMAPFYIGLIFVLMILLFDFGRQMVHLVTHLNEGGHDPIVIGILG